MSAHTPVVEHQCLAHRVQRIYRFANHYGESVIQSPVSYGGDEGRWELAVLRFLPRVTGVAKFVLDYSTAITDDVIGWLNEGDVDEILDRIAALPAPNDDQVEAEDA